MNKQSGKKHIVRSSKRPKNASRTRSGKGKRVPPPPPEKLWLNSSEHARDSLTRVIRSFHAKSKKNNADRQNLRTLMYAFSTLLGFFNLQQRQKETDLDERLTELEKLMRDQGGAGR